MLGIDKQETHYPLEKTIIHFKDNGKLDIVKEFLFVPPKFDPTVIAHIFTNSNRIVSKIAHKKPLSVTEHEDVLRLPTNYLISYLYGHLEAPNQLRKAKEYIKNLPDKTTYMKYKDAMRVLRKVKYS